MTSQASRRSFQKTWSELCPHSDVSHIPRVTPCQVKITPMSYDVLRIMAPLVGVSLINVLTGLGGTQRWDTRNP